jgi:hypothetical protein
MVSVETVSLLVAEETSQHDLRQTHVLRKQVRNVHHVVAEAEPTEYFRQMDLVDVQDRHGRRRVVIHHEAQEAQHARVQVAAILPSLDCRFCAFPPYQEVLHFGFQHFLSLSSRVPAECAAFVVGSARRFDQAEGCIVFAWRKPVCGDEGDVERAGRVCAVRMIFQYVLVNKARTKFLYTQSIDVFHKLIFLNEFGHLLALYSLYLCLFHAEDRICLWQCILFPLRHAERTQNDVKVGRMVRLRRANCCVRAKVLATPEHGKLDPASRAQARSQDDASPHPSSETTLLHSFFLLALRFSPPGSLRRTSTIHMWFLRDGMKFPVRRYATIASGKSLLRGKKGPPLSLEHVGTVFYTKVWAVF